MRVELVKIDYSMAQSPKERRLSEHNSAYSLLDKMLADEGIFEYEIVKNENGKPFLKDDSIFFSISHTDGLCAVCISDSPIGIDCEKIDPSYKEKIASFATRYFVDNEIDLLNKNGNDVVTFFKIWTSKEAIIKKLGLNGSYLKKIDTTKENIETSIVGDYIISIFK